MTSYSAQPLKLDHVHTYPLKSRASKVSVADFAKPLGSGASISQWIGSLPRILAAESFRGLIAALEGARKKRKPIIWGLGGHVIKVGLAPVLIDLIRRGYITAFALNGAALIHDFEIGFGGATSEDVPAELGKGRFGMAEETGRYINESIIAGAREHLGMGEAVGRFLASCREARYKRHSLLACAYREKIPVTVHAAIGTDIVHCHPSVDARALGEATHRDFLLLAALTRQLSGGGVYLNIGSAVILPEVFLKCIGLAANTGRALRGITTANLDFIQHYRPAQNVVARPIAAAGGARGGSRGFSITGHHELMIPLLAAALGAGRLRRRARGR